MSDKQPPAGGPGRRASRPGARKATKAPAAGPADRSREGSAASAGAAGAGKGKPSGSGKNGKVRARDLSGWPKARHIGKKTLKWGSIVGFAGLVMAAIAVYVTYKMIDIPDPNTDFQAQTTTVYYADGKHVLGQFSLQNRQSIPLSEMPTSMQDAAMSAEDRSFETNKGVDPKGIVRAAWNNLHSDSDTQGASTITQQYVKILYLSQERTLSRKVKEAFLAVKVQNSLSKDEILEGYLNTIYFGRGAYGVQAASKAFFDKDAKDLTVPESAVLASVLNSPGTLDPAQGKEAKQALKERYEYVLEGMVSMGNLDADRAVQYERRLPKFPDIPEVSNYGGQRGYLLNLVQEKLQQLKFTDEEISGGGLKVVTTLSWRDSIAAAKAVTEERPDGRPQLHVALSAVDPRTGALRAMIGGRDYTGGGPKDQVNFALAPTQVGSTMKAYAVAAGLEDGFTLRDTFDGNSPYTYPNGETVRNEGQSSSNPSGNSYGSAISLTYATEESVNTAFADLTSRMKNGPEKVVDAAVAAGVPEDSPDLEPNLGVALGSATIPNVEMAEGYSTFANNGVHHDWYVIEKVTDANGLRYEHKVQGDRAFTPAISSNVTYALRQVVDSGTGSGAQALQRPAAGKTGTATFGTSDNQYVSSSWFVGFTPQLSTAITYTRGDGNDSLEGYLEPFYGANYPTQTWTSFMEKALADSPSVDFPDPAELHGEDPTYSPPPTTFAPPSTTYEPPATTTTTSEPPSTTSEPPSTTSEPPPSTTSEPPPSTSTGPTTSSTTSVPTTSTEDDDDGGGARPRDGSDPGG